jgi:hypothetical protein
MKKIDVSCYFRPDRMDPNAPDDADKPLRGEDDPTYSVVLGYGWRKSPKPRPKEPSDRKKAD